MKGSRQGDFTRLREGGENTSAVRMQQGRVQLDADWNEAFGLLDRRLREGTLDLVGEGGAPAGDAGFAVGPGELAPELGTPDHFILVGGAEGFRLPGSGEAENSASGSTGAGDAGLRIEGRMVPFGDGRLLSLWRRPPERRKFRVVWGLALEGDRLVLHRSGENEVRSCPLPGLTGALITVAVDAGPAGTVLRVDGDSVGEGSGMEVPPGPLSVMVGSHNQPAFRGLACSAAVDRLPAADGSEDGAPYGAQSQRVAAWDFTLSPDEDGDVGHDGGGEGVGEKDAGGEGGGGPDLSGGDDAGGRATAPGTGEGRHRFAAEGELDAVAVLRGGGGQPPRWLPVDLTLGRGRFYAGGVLFRLVEGTSVRRQPDLPGAVLPSPAGREPEHHVLYLDLWERTVAAAQDPALMEPALGGADTVTHGRLVGQVRSQRWQPGEAGAGGGGGGDTGDGDGGETELDDIPRVGAVHSGWAGAVPPLEERGRLAARRREPAAEELENVLYRVEIHRPGGGEVRAERRGRELRLDTWEEGWWEGCVVVLSGSDGWTGTARVVTVREAGARLTLHESPAEAPAEVRVRRLATFKWSRHNAAIVFPVVSAAAGDLEIAPSGRDLDGLEVGAVVELVDHDTAVLATPGTLRRVVAVDLSRHRVTVEPAPPPRAEGGNLALRLWDQRGRGLRSDLAVDAAMGEWLPLEKGVEVRFGYEGAYRVGDYWWIPARTATGGVDWPEAADGTAVALPPRGIEHATAPLALLSYTAGGFRLTDLRKTFHPHAVDAVRKAGDWMDGDLELRAGLSVAGDAEVAGRVRADALYGRVVSRGAVGAGQLTSGAVTVRSLSPDVGVVPPGGSILLPTVDPPRGYAATGWVVTAERENPDWQDRGVLPNPSPGPLVSVTAGVTTGVTTGVTSGNRIYTLLESGEVWAYDPREDTWQGGSGLPEPLEGFAAAALDGHIYVAGGIAAEGQPSERLLRYEPESGHWVELAPLPTPRSHLALAACQGRLHALGGWEAAWLGPKVSRRHEIYEPGIDSWTSTGRSRLPRGVAEASAVAIGDRIHLVGGQGRWLFGRWGDYLTDAHRVHRDGGDGWASVAGLATPRRRVGLAAVESHLAAVGGEGSQGWTDDCDVYDPSSDTWRGLPPTHRPVPAAGVTSLAGTVYLTGAPASDGSGVLMETLPVRNRFHVHRWEGGEGGEGGLSGNPASES